MLTIMFGESYSLISGIHHQSGAGRHLQEAGQPPGGAKEAAGSREASEHCFVKEIH